MQCVPSTNSNKNLTHKHAVTDILDDVIPQKHGKPTVIAARGHW